MSNDIDTKQDIPNPPIPNTVDDQKLIDYVRHKEQEEKTHLSLIENTKLVDSHQDAEDNPHPGGHKLFTGWGLVIILIFIISGVVAFILGALERGELKNFFGRITSHSTPQVIFVESQGDKSLFVENDGERRRIMVQHPDRKGWEQVSQYDFTASNPALSPDALWVAYLSTQKTSHIVLVPLEQAGQITYTSDDLAKWGRTHDITLTEICPWTPISWAMDSKKFAFFGCTEGPAVSRAFAGDFFTSTLDVRIAPITGSLAIGDEPRQILWLGSDQVSVTFPPTAPGEPETVEVFSVPKR